MIHQNNILRFEKISQFQSLVHGFSTRFFGSMRPSHNSHQESIKKFTSALQVSVDDLVRMDEVHGNGMYEITEQNKGQTIPQTDGIFTQEQNIFLGVVTADCVPLLFYDPQENLIAAVHAGWRGLYSEIINEAILCLREKHSNIKNIFVGLGPCIRSCHYEITKDHTKVLLDKFPEWYKFIPERAGKYYLDLPGVAIFQLRRLGVLLENIEDGNYCTFEHDDVYSARRDGKDFGEIMGIIGIIS